jgi:hypothetical protein
MPALRRQLQLAACTATLATLLLWAAGMPVARASSAVHMLQQGDAAYSSGNYNRCVAVCCGLLAVRPAVIGAPGPLPQPLPSIHKTTHRHHATPTHTHHACSAIDLYTSALELDPAVPLFYTKRAAAFASLRKLSAGACAGRPWRGCV